MKNKEIFKDKWYKLIGLDDSGKYFSDHFIEWDLDGFHHRDHLLQQSHMRNFSDPLDVAFDVFTYPINSFLYKKHKQFKSTDDFGYLPNFNRYLMRNCFIGPMFSFEDIEVNIIGKLEATIANTAKYVKSSTLSLDNVKKFAEMFAIQRTLRNFKLNIQIENSVNQTYEHEDISNFSLKLIDLALENRRQKTDLSEVFFQTDDQIEDVCDISKNKNYFKVQVIYKHYINYKQWITDKFVEGCLINLNDNVFLTSDAYGFQFKENIYIPISPSKLVILSKKPFKTSFFDLSFVSIINFGLIMNMSLFAVWGSHYKPDVPPNIIK